MKTHAVAQLGVLLLAGAALLAQTPAPQTPPPPAGLDIAAIDRAVGKSGQVMAGDVYRISFPRTDLNVTVGSVHVRAGFALGGWAAFKAANGQTVAHGDLVLLESEINPVISTLQQHNFEITALHNHIISASTPTMYLHFWGQGKADALGRALKDALSHTKTPMTAPAAAPAAAPDFDADGFQKAIGLKGTVTNGVLGLSQPRPETIQMHGVTLPASMGMATAINVQSAGAGKVAATGDLVMLADEVNKVARALRQNDIAITALHNHLLHGGPELYFMHFWGEGDPAKVAAGLKAGLDQLKK